MLKFIVGIDPGITGALALVGLNDEGDVRLLDVQDMPVATLKVGRANKSHILPSGVASILRDWNEHPFATSVDVFIEEVHAMPGQGVTSMFRFGHALGLVEGVAAGLGLRTHKVPPKTWQTAVRVQKEPDAGRLRASQIFPDGAKFFVRKMDHNRADAALIAYAGARLTQDPS